MLHGTYLCIMATDSLDFTWSQPNVSEKRRASSFIFVKEAEEKSTPLLLSWLSACVWNSCKRSLKEATTCNPTGKAPGGHRDMHCQQQLAYTDRCLTNKQVGHVLPKHRSVTTTRNWQRTLLCLIERHRSKKKKKNYVNKQRTNSWWWLHWPNLLLGLLNQAAEACFAHEAFRVPERRYKAASSAAA